MANSIIAQAETIGTSAANYPPSTRVISINELETLLQSAETSTKRAKSIANKYTQGICTDGAAILKNGQMMTIEEILAELNSRAATGLDKEKIVVWLERNLPHMFSYALLNGIERGDFDKGTEVLTYRNEYKAPVGSAPDLLRQQSKTIEELIRVGNQLAALVTPNLAVNVARVEWKNLVAQIQEGTFDPEKKDD